MAKAAKSKAAIKSPEVSENSETGSVEMDIDQAQAIIKKYDGINGVRPADELLQARQVIKDNL